MLQQLHIQESTMSKVLDWSAYFWVNDCPKIEQCTTMITVTSNNKQYKFQSLFYLMQYQFITSNDSIVYDSWHIINDI